MGEPATAAVGGSTEGGALDPMERYNQEKEKRLRDDGTKQYIDLQRSDKLKRFIKDPWLEPAKPMAFPVSDGAEVKVLIIGAGLGGILMAVRLLSAGISLDQILIVDRAGSFGGTWYYNRYPGLHCDVEAYLYLPLLEEMDNYMPKTKYASGVEIREYMEAVASKYHLHERAMFQSSVENLTWDEETRQWNCKITSTPNEGKETHYTLHSNFAVVAPGILHNAKFPDVSGIEQFPGQMFHTSRWDYDFTGGSPESPELSNLTNKKVAIVGTGATAVQAVPHLAKYAKHLYVFQRTPSSVDVRGNRETNPDEWKHKIATRKGWQRERQLNFQSFLNNPEPKPSEDLVDDGWTKFPSYSALLGTPKPVGMDNVAQHLQQLHGLDYPRQERIRQRVSEIVVKDPQAAEKLQAWYPGWCKRPCFHDEYLDTFNKPNVTLVDTDGKGIDRITEDGIEYAGHVYDVDLIVWGTGFQSPALGSVAKKADVKIIGRNGLDMEDANSKGQLLTLHGCIGRGFPNIFWFGPRQSGAAANVTLMYDVLTQHVAYMVSKGFEKAGSDGKPVVEPTAEAQEEWAMKLMMGAAAFAGVAGCLPSYLNAEGESNRIPREMQMEAAKRGAWPYGFQSYAELLEAWQESGDMAGIEVTVGA